MYACICLLPGRRIHIHLDKDIDFLTWVYTRSPFVRDKRQWQKETLSCALAIYSVVRESCIFFRGKRIASAHDDVAFGHICGSWFVHICLWNYVVRDSFLFVREKEMANAHMSPWPCFMCTWYVSSGSWLIHTCEMTYWYTWQCSL